MKSWVTHIVTWVTAGSGLLTAIVSFFTAGEALLAKVGLGNVPRVVLVAVGVALLCIATLAYWINRPRSRLKDPSQLQLRRDEVRHLKGRKHDTDLLMRKCERESIIELQGLSGCGKSALIRAGLLPQITQSSSLLPLIFEYHGSDWERAPEEALLREIDQAMDRYRNPEASKPPTAEIALGLRNLKQMSRRTPLLIFDQVDDYLQAHQAMFITPERSTLRCEALVASNRFWAAIAKAIVAGDARVILVARAEMASWLSSFRFVRSDDYHLPSVDAPAIRSMLEEIGDPKLGAITDADAGWNELVGDIVDDTTVNGLILPQRLRLVLGGLEGLRWLTPEEYRRVGRNVGVEGLYVDGAVARAAGASQLTPPTVRAILIALVDPEQLKTRRRTLVELTAVLDPTVPPALLNAVTIAVKELHARAIVRFVFDPSSSENDQIVQLDHDYLAPAIIRSNRQANRWNLLLQERAAAFRKARWNPFKRWQALLGPRDLAHTFWARLSGSADAPLLAGRAGLVSLSILSLFIPLAGIALMGFIGRTLYADYEFQRSESSIISSMGSEGADEPTPAFWKHLRTLSHRPLRHRRSLLIHTISDPNAMERVVGALPVLVRGLAGASEDARLELVRAVRMLDDPAFTPAQLIARDSVLGLLDAEPRAPALTLAKNALSIFEVNDEVELPASFLRVLERRLSTSGVEEKAKVQQLICEQHGFWHQARFVNCPRGTKENSDDDDDPASSGSDRFAEILKEAKSDKALREVLTTYPIPRSRLERREWYQKVVEVIGNKRLDVLLKSGSDWAWGTPLGEFHPALEKISSTEVRLQLSRTYTIGGWRDAYRFMLMYAGLDPGNRREVQTRIRRELLSGNSHVCNLYGQFRSELGVAELHEFVRFAMTREDDSGSSTCLNDEDIQLASKLILEAASDALPAGSDFLHGSLRRMPDSAERRKLVSILRAHHLERLETVEDSSVGRAGAWRQVGLLLDEDLLRTSLSARDLDKVWHTVTVAARLHVTSIGALADLHRWHELMKRPVGSELTAQIVELLSTQSINRLEISPWRDGDLILTRAAQLVGSLPPDARDQIADGIFANLCESQDGTNLSEAITLLSAAQGSAWNEEPWLTRRQRLVDFPWTYGAPTDALLGDKLADDPEPTDERTNTHRWFVWERVAAFRKKHGGVLDAREARSVCAN